MTNLTHRCTFCTRPMAITGTYGGRAWFRSCV